MKENIDFNFGDLVRCDGYWPRIFTVIGYRFEHYHYPTESWTDLVYELIDAHSGEWLEADEADLTLAETADQAEEFLRDNPAKESHWTANAYITIKTEKPAPKPTPRELSAQEADKRKADRKSREDKINVLLEIAEWNRRMLDKTGDESYGDSLFACEAELKKLVETE